MDKLFQKMLNAHAIDGGHTLVPQHQMTSVFWRAEISPCASAFFDELREGRTQKIFFAKASMILA